MSEVFCSILGENVFNVEIFENANSLLKYIENNPLQVVLAEYKIPEINDIKHIEQLNKARIGVPVIIVSSYTVGIDTKFAYKVLSKPVDADVLIDTIQKALLDRYSGQIFDIDPALVKKNRYDCYGWFYRSATNISAGFISGAKTISSQCCSIANSSTIQNALIKRYFQSIGIETKNHRKKNFT